MVDIKVGKNYQMIRKIGSGAFGEIFEGKRQGTVKLIRQAYYD